MNESLRAVVQDHPFFQGMKPEHLEIVAGCASELRFKPGQFLFHEGEPANQFYLIQSGRIALEAHEPADGTAPVQNLGAGEVLGWSWMFPPFVWHFQARALEPTRTIVLNGAHLLVTAERDHQFGYELMKRVAQVVVQRLQAARKQLLTQPMKSGSGG
jgi:CRP-like cAMP-binding protein